MFSSHLDRDPVPHRVMALWEMVRLVNMLIVFRFLRIIPEIKVGDRLLASKYSHDTDTTAVAEHTCTIAFHLKKKKKKVSSRAGY